MSDGTARDSAWFEALFRQHGNQVLAYASRRCPAEADDVVAEVFAAAWKHRQTVPAEALPWLYRTAAHQVMHSHRGSSRRAALVSRSARMDEPDRNPPDVADEVVAQLDRSTVVGRVMAALPAADAEVLRLWAWEQLGTEEIAYVLVISNVAARVRLHRARRRAEALLRGAGASTQFSLVLSPDLEELR